MQLQNEVGSHLGRTLHCFTGYNPSHVDYHAQQARSDGFRPSQSSTLVAWGVHKPDVRIFQEVRKPLLLSQVVALGLAQAQALWRRCRGAGTPRAPASWGSKAGSGRRRQRATSSQFSRPSPPGQKCAPQTIYSLQKSHWCRCPILSFRRSGTTSCKMSWPICSGTMLQQAGHAVSAWSISTVKRSPATRREESIHDIVIPDPENLVVGSRWLQGSIGMCSDAASLYCTSHARVGGSTLHTLKPRSIN